MAITHTQLDAATEALELALKFDRPADSVLHEFFRARRGLGARDRAFVAEAVYGVLRRKRTVDHLAPDGGPRRKLLAYVVRAGGVSVRELGTVARPEEQSWLAEIKQRPLHDLPPAARAELPDWIYERLSRSLPEPEVMALARGLSEPAPLDLRVNTLRATREEAQRDLAASGIQAATMPYSPVGLRVAGRPSISDLPLFERGAIEVQDEGSQLVCQLVAPRRQDLVVDFCAGAGGKSLMLGAMMRSHGRVYAFDVSASRLARLKPRLKRSGLSNLHPATIRDENDTRVKRLAGKIDRVLVDAPCSGLGTLRRNPDLKWRQSPASVDELTARQAAILHASARLVKPGGRLVYATCSLLAEENEDIVTAFLARHAEFQAVDCAEILRNTGISLDTGLFLKLFPHRHATDGFFAAVLARN